MQFSKLWLLALLLFTPLQLFAADPVLFTNRASWQAASSNLRNINFEGLVPEGEFAIYTTPSGLTVANVNFVGISPSNQALPYFLWVYDASYYPPFYDWGSGAVLSGPPVPRGSGGEGGPNSHIRVTLPNGVRSVGSDIMSFEQYASSFDVVVVTTTGRSLFTVNSFNLPNRAFVGFTSPDPILYLEFYANNGYPLLDNFTYGATQSPRPAVRLSPSSWSFGNQRVNTSSALQTFILSNTGNATLNITGVALSGDVADFSLDNGCPSSLNAGASCSIRVTFTPTTAGARTGTLVITNNAADSPQTVTLTGTGWLPGAPAVDLFPLGLNFSNEKLNQTSAPQRVTITNSGNSTLSNLRTTATGDFAARNLCRTSLSPGASCVINVTFRPTSSGARSGELSISNSASDSPQKVILAGTSNVDTDGDGLPDDWEINGVTIDGVFLDLPHMGAKPLRKDVFVRADYMVLPPSCNVSPCDPGHSHQLKPEAAMILIGAFENAPVSNPDGSTGITLHLDGGPDYIMNPATGEKWGTFSEARSLPHSDPLSGRVNEIGRLGDCTRAESCGVYDWAAFEVLKTNNLSSARASVFHYGVVAHNLGGRGSDSGLSRSGAGSAGSDFIVSLGSFTDGVGTVFEQAGTTFHELGHNFGLPHGGKDAVPSKPNYLSVMNYLFQTRGLLINGQDGNFDYSRAELPVLDENKLDEQVGLNGGAAINNYGTRYYCNGAKSDTVVINADGPIDWNCNGNSMESSVRANINQTPPGIPLEKLSSYDDWANLVFTGGGIGLPGVSLPSPRVTPIDELTEELDATITTLQGVAVLGPGDTSLPPGGETTLTFTVVNKGNSGDTFSLSATVSGSWADLGQVPAQVSLPAGGTAEINIPINVPVLAGAATVNQIFVKATSQTNPRVVDAVQAAVTVAAADLTALVKMNSSEPVSVGSKLIYRITVTNKGPNEATSVIVTDALPNTLSLVSATPSIGSCAGTTTIRCDLGPLSSGSTATIDVVAIATTYGNFTNRVQVASAVADPVIGNNSTSVSTRVAKPNLTAQIIEKTKTGDTLIVKLKITNTGTGRAENAMIDQVVLRTRGGAGKPTHNSPTLPIPIKNLAVGGSDEITLNLTVPSTVTKFTITESGLMKDAAGNTYKFAFAQVVFP